jgi:hypothetical protein
MILSNLPPCAKEEELVRRKAAAINIYFESNRYDSAILILIKNDGGLVEQLIGGKLMGR